jgi:superfamily II DNA/RNA helicase
MVDMGFIDDIKKILAMLPENRQSLFFSATVPPRISFLVKSFLKDPVTVSVKSAVTSDNVEQDIVKVRRDQQKIEVLHELLIQDDFKKVLIFGQTKRGVEKLSNELSVRGFKSTSIHGDKPQNKRERALRSFKQDELNILVATDVAARGLDINGVTHVINYDLPENYEDYIHRIGRTGRANNRGVALTFVS